MNLADFDQVAGTLAAKAAKDEAAVKSIHMGTAQAIGRRMADTAPSKSIAASVTVFDDRKHGVTVTPRHPLAHLFEYGTGPRYQKTTGRYTGVMSPRPFVWPAVDAEVPDMLDRIERVVGGL